MLLVVGAIVVGILLGLALGGRLANLAEVTLRWWPLALVGLALQLIPVPSMEGQIDHWLAVGLLAASYAVLLVFVAVNIRLPGFPVVAVGFALNLLVISLNGGMAVSDEALHRAYGPGPGYEKMYRVLVEHGGAKHHLAGPDDVLRPLTDVIPVGGPIRLVLSVGDVLFYVGVVWLLAAATKGLPGRGSRESVRPRSPAGVGGDPPSTLRPAGEPASGIGRPAPPAPQR
jgi:hypothetical protein